jgi:SH3-like domain-containing protein
VLALLPGGLLATEVLWLGPARPPQAVALGKLELVSEPRTGLPPVASVAPGTRVTLRSDGGGEWVRVDAEGHSGYAPRKQLGKID